MNKKRNIHYCGCCVFLESVDKIDIRYRRERKTVIVIKKKPRTRFARRGSRLARPKGCRNDCVVPERAAPHKMGPRRTFLR